MAHLGHVSASSRRDSPLVIKIWVDADDPPTGRVVACFGDPPQPFAGWLQLLAILAQAVSRDRFPVKPPGGPPPERGRSGN